MSTLMREMVNYANEIGKVQNLSITLQLCDRSLAPQGLFQFLDVQVPAEAPQRYRAENVFVHDPFTLTEVNENPARAVTDAPMRPADSFIAAHRAGCAQYWGFLQHFNFAVEAVAVRRLKQGVYLSVGFLTDVRVTRDPVPDQLMREAASTLHNMMAAHILQTVMREGERIDLVSCMTGRQHDALVPPCYAGLGHLSPRELEISRLASAGRKSKQIAFDLRLSEYTVNNHLRRIYEKLGIHSRAELAFILH